LNRNAPKGVRHPKITVLLAPILFLFLACDLFLPCPQQEMQRVTSPDKKVDAVIIDEDCGATISLIRNVYIVPSGDQIKDEYLVLRATHTDYLKVEWMESKYLIISYKKATLHITKDTWFSNDIDGESYEIKISREVQ